MPTFTSAAAATAATGKAFSFTVATVGSPTSYTTNVTRSGTLPAGVSFSNNGNGTATLTGTPTAASAGTYPVTFTAANTGGTTTQSFVLTVTGAPGDHLGGHRHGHRRLRLLLHGQDDRGARPGPGRGRLAAAGPDLD